MSKNEKKSFIVIYKEADPEGRFQILLDNYAIVSKEIRKAEKKLEFKIKAEKEWARSRAREELGVRVQTSSKGDQTANEAIANVMLEEAFKTGELDNSVFNGIADFSEYEEEFHIIRILKMDYELLVELVEGLADDDARIMKCRFGEGRYLKELADDEGKTIQAITKRLDRLTNELKEEILDYLEMSSGNFNA